jgi:hypothetical protein
VSTTHTLPAPASRVGVVCGPGEFPEDHAGVVLCHVTDRWGSHAVVLMDTGETRTCHGLNRGPGIGWHQVTRRGRG